jgi:hypothetical protein
MTEVFAKSEPRIPRADAGFFANHILLPMLATVFAAFGFCAAWLVALSL